MDDGQVDSRLIKIGEAEKRIDTFFAGLKVGYIHLRDGEADFINLRRKHLE